MSSTATPNNNPNSRADAALFILEKEGVDAIKTAFMIAMNLGERTNMGGRWVQDKSGQKEFKNLLILRWVDPLYGYSILTDSFGDRMVIKNPEGRPVLKWSKNGGFEHNGTLQPDGRRYYWVDHLNQVLQEHALPMRDRIEQEYAARRTG